MINLAVSTKHEATSNIIWATILRSSQHIQEQSSAVNHNIYVINQTEQWMNSWTSCTSLWYELAKMTESMLGKVFNFDPCCTIRMFWDLFTFLAELRCCTHSVGVSLDGESGVYRQDFEEEGQPSLERVFDIGAQAGGEVSDPLPQRCLSDPVVFNLGVTFWVSSHP